MTENANEKTPNVQEDADAVARGEAGGPVDESDMAAAEGLSTPQDAAETYEDMLERGADQKGEGRLP